MNKLIGKVQYIEKFSKISNRFSYWILTNDNDTMAGNPRFWAWRLSIHALVMVYTHGSGKITSWS
jgi:hypothetical protein